MSKGVKFSRGLVIPIVKRIMPVVRKHVKLAKVCGSLRRGAQRVSDIDIVTAGGDAHAAMKELGYTPVDVRGIRHEFDASCEGVPVHVDVWMIPEESFGGAVMYATGSGILNVVQRRWAIYKGLKLNTHGVFKDDKLIAGLSEEDCYAAIGWKYIPPQERDEIPEYAIPMIAEMNAAIGDNSNE